MNNELFQGVKPCNACDNYKLENRKHVCTKSGERTETARLKSESCFIEKKGK